MKKKNLMWHSLAFLIPFVVAVLICAWQGVYPFGEKCILHVDMYHQYCPFFTEFMNKLKNGESLMYSFHHGLGADFVALYAYYLASPLNFLMLLWPKGYVIEFMTLLTWIKVGLCSLFFFMFLKGHFSLNTQKWESTYQLRALCPALIFSVTYAFSGYITAYSWNIMWLDGVMLLPLILLGLERLLQGECAALYFISLSLAIFSNYYIAIMICIFVMLYFMAYAIMHKKVLREFLRFAWFSFLSGAAAAVLILPEMHALTQSGSSKIAFPSEVKWYFNIFAELARGCTTAEAYTGANFWPNLYAGAFSFFLFFLFLFNRNIRVKKKILGAGAVAFFLLSFSNNVLTFLWHGLDFPDSLPARQSFLYIFLLLLIGYEVILKWEGLQLIHTAIAGGVSVAIVVVCAFFKDDAVTEDSAIVITVLFLAGYICLLLLLQVTSGKKRQDFAMVLMFFALGEVMLHMTITGFYTTSRTAYMKNADEYATLLEKAKELSGEEFYRVEDIERLTKNDDMRFGYAGATQFSSLMNIEVSHLFQSLYMEGGKNFYCYNGANPLTSAFWGVKYILSGNEFLESKYRTLVAKEGQAYLYENVYCLPLGFVVQEESIDAWKANRTNRFGSVNSFASAFGAAEPLLSEVPCDQASEEGKTTITVGKSGFYYASYEKCDADTLQLETKWHGKRKFSKTTHKYLLELGELSEGETVTITNKKKEEIAFHVYCLNPIAVEQAFATLNEQPLTIKSFSDTKIQAQIEVQRSGRLVFTIPMDEGWSVYVDGEKKTAHPFADALLAVDVEEGEHELLLTYETVGLKQGALISAVALLFAVGTLLLGYSKRKKLNQ